MKLYTFRKAGAAWIGAESAEGKIVDLQAAHVAREGVPSAAFASMQSLIDAGEDGLAAARLLVVDPPSDSLVAVNEVKILAPLPRPVMIRGFAVYDRHLRQGAEGVAWLTTADEPDREAAYRAMLEKVNLANVPPPGWYERPLYYNADPTVIIGTGEEVTWPAYSSWIDYEWELVAIIGKTGKDIPRDRAKEHIFGYSVLNDLSARDEQLKSTAVGPFNAKGKDFDGANPLGPCIVTADEVYDPYKLPFKIRVNGELWAEGTAEEARYRFEECIAYLSQSQTVNAGEIFSGGCAPNGCSIELKRTVKRGDLIELDTDMIGTLSTRIV